ncbi:MAG: SRPBCC family protein [Robiginitomaculum sp.]|nr:SRPBCC family protein [Robiginitomaculum sp.]
MRDVIVTVLYGYACYKAHMLRTLHRIIIIIFLSAAIAFGASADSPAKKPVQLPNLNDGEVFIHVNKITDTTGKSAQISSAILIEATPEAIWAVITDCARASTYVPGLKKCEILKKDPDGLWDFRRHTNKISPFLPTIKSEFRSEYDYPTSIKFKSAGGDMDTNSGAWDFTFIEASGKTLVSYNARVASKTIIPDKVIRKTLKKNIPKVMRTLRAEVMADQNKLVKTIK